MNYIKRGPESGKDLQRAEKGGAVKGGIMKREDYEKLDAMVEATLCKIRDYNHSDRMVIKVDRAADDAEVDAVCERLVEMGVLKDDYGLMGYKFFEGAADKDAAEECLSAQAM